MSTALPRLDAITGAPLIGTWASSVRQISRWSGTYTERNRELLYMAEFLQAMKYFRNFKKDHWKLKSYVAVAFAIDTISALGDYACVYLYTITHAGDPVYLSKQNWAVPLYLISTSCVAVLAQSFLTLKYWRFTKNTVVVCFLSILILAGFGGGLSTGITLVLFPAFEDRDKIWFSGPFFIVTQSSADLVIAGAFVREFMRAKSLFKDQQRRINNVLDRLVSRTIQTGTATAFIAVLSLVVFLINDKTNTPVGIMYPLGRIYVLSMLMNLNIRESVRPKNWTSAGQQRTLGFAHSTTNIISSVQFRHTSEPQSSSSGTVKSSVLSTASISETRLSEMVPTDTKQVPEV
ncbi:hypothetical protein C8R45DRAFT_1097846 [Mycena sanguinolenta]|nr:hypothetical protein C8R45DRAFT_1097846 [Mycena sanguinolenta]